jgi:hypothetical protein
MMFVKLTKQPDGSIKAETSRQVLGYFEDTAEKVAAYLVDQAEAVGETIRFVDDFEEREEIIDFQRLMKRHF